MPTSRSSSEDREGDGRAQRTRRRLLDCAARLFAERGYAGTSTTDILRAAGVTKGALYFHFGSKEDLARAAVADRELLWRQLARDVGKRHPRALEQMLALTDEVARLFRTDRSAVAVAGFSAELVAIDPTARAPYAGWLGVVTELMAAAQADGDFTEDVPAEVMARTLVSAFVGAEMISSALTNNADLPERMRDVWSLLMPGFTGGAAVLDRPTT